MSKAIGQPIGQKRLTNVAIVRMKSHGVRFEIACYKNKVLSWRSGVEKDLDEVLQSQTVYTNVSKGIVAKSKDLMLAFGTDNHSKISLEILNKGELQVAGKERESQLTSQFRDIATIVMEKTINPETQHPYTISMIERLMHEIHFAVDPNSSSKKQALEVIRDLQKQFPIKRSPMRLRLLVPEQHADALMDMLNTWEAHIHSKDRAMCHLSVVCQLDPGFFRECDSTVRNFQGQLEILDVSLHADQNILAFQGEDHEPAPTSLQSDSEKTVTPLIDEFSKQVSISKEAVGSDQQEKSKKCSTCDALVGNAKEYREHCKTTWHTQNVKRRAMKMLPITMEESDLENEVGQYKDDLKDYSF